MSCNFYGLTIYPETLHQLLSLYSDREADVLLPQMEQKISKSERIPLA